MFTKKIALLAGVVTVLFMGSVIAAVVNSDPNTVKKTHPTHREYAVKPDKEPTQADREAVPVSASPEAQHFSNGADTNPHSNPHTNETNLYEDR